jgi:hypothetical protein
VRRHAGAARAVRGAAGRGGYSFTMTCRGTV